MCPEPFHSDSGALAATNPRACRRLWHSTTYRLENTLNYSLERVWCIAYSKGSNKVAIGHDEGVVMVRLGQEEPVVSMDTSGKIIWARNTEIQTVNVKSLPAEADLSDGERLPLAVKDLGAADIFPQSLSHAPNGRFVAVCGDGEYTVYTALAWRNKAFGQALEFVWAADPSEFAIRESPSRIKVQRNFQDKFAVNLGYSVEGIHGGQLLAVRSEGFVLFYEWSKGAPVRRIDVEAKGVFWSDSGDYVAITTDSSFYVLRYHADQVAAALASGVQLDEDGLEDAFELLYEAGLLLALPRGRRRLLPACLLTCHPPRE